MSIRLPASAQRWMVKALSFGLPGAGWVESVSTGLLAPMLKPSISTLLAGTAEDGGLRQMGPPPGGPSMLTGEC